MKNVPLAPKKITTNRFLFHVSHPSNRTSIFQNGLVVQQKTNSLIPNGIYAHNSIQEPNFSWYPFSFFGEYDSNELLGICPLKFYDYWRIDTSLISNEWYLDHAASEDYKLINHTNPKKLFTYSPENIPLAALKLYRFQQEKHVHYISENGVLHIRNSKEFSRFV